MKILLIEDDPDFASILESQLAKNGFQVDVCSNGSDGLFYLEQQSYHLVLLDRMLPVLDGMSFLQLIRQKGVQTPVIIITGLGALPDKLTGLNGGADDYLVKPFAFEELLARIHCILRRPAALQTKQPVTAGDITYDLCEKEICCGTKSCRLTARESALLELFIRHPGQTLTRKIIFSEIWENTDVEYGNLDNYIYFLRNRLRSVESKAEIRTIRGIGYRFITGGWMDV